ncbi:MlaD family protein [Gordonia sp. (in: high G+C Gram-positive bacteria)]|uniref:MCE family protein n=1 Tax=Gordonia sp. (in: high G+C Gram-positive bacteria) TaxID=84139 RepID=UPI0016A05499|nr:MlaD family protein [Gordonia sp. (in: high G+C Gram-positive bacteria)]NLG47797.1 MCE family protein [Gordonia sp. (in: high G+C Gram-positive bacteria)]
MRGVIAPLVKLIIFALITVFATAMLGLTIANAGSGGNTSFKAVFSDAAMLNPGDDVRIAGVRVGQIESVEITDRSKALVGFSVDRERLPKSTQLFIRYRNLTGLRYMALEKGVGPTGETVDKGYTFENTAADKSTHDAVNLTELFNGFKPLFKQITPEDMNKLAETMIKVFQGDMDTTISDLINDTAGLTNALADKDKVIGDMITNLTQVLDTVNRNDEQFSDLLINTEKLITGLAAQRDSVGSAVSSVANLTTVTGSILSKTRPAIQGDIAGIKSLSDQLNSRTEDIETTLTNLPVKLQKIGRAATFGSWFQFYMCGIDVVAGNGKSTKLTQPVVPLPNINHVLYTSAATRCWRDQKPGG